MSDTRQRARVARCRPVDRGRRGPRPLGDSARRASGGRCVVVPVMAVERHDLDHRPVHDRVLAMPHGSWFDVVVGRFGAGAGLVEVVVEGIGDVDIGAGEGVAVFARGDLALVVAAPSEHPWSEVFVVRPLVLESCPDRRGRGPDGEAAAMPRLRCRDLLSRDRSADRQGAGCRGRRPAAQRVRRVGRRCRPRFAVSASTSGSRSPAASALSIARPDTPRTFDATEPVEDGTLRMRCVLEETVPGAQDPRWSYFSEGSTAPRAHDLADPFTNDFITQGGLRPSNALPRRSGKVSRLRRGRLRSDAA